MARVTAIVGAVFIFFVVYILVGFFAIRMFEGSRLEWAGVAITVVVASLAALGSYKASMRRSRKDPAA
jgi:hypothetical protein